MRNPQQSIDTVCTKITGSVGASDEGTGIIPTIVYEWKAGIELDTAIDSAIQQEALAAVVKEGQERGDYDVSIQGERHD